MHGRRLNERFAEANAAGRGGLVEPQGGHAAEARLAQGRASGAVNLAGLGLGAVPVLYLP